MNESTGEAQPGVWVDRRREAPPRLRPSAIAEALNRRIRQSGLGRRWITDQFHRIYYDDRDQTWNNTYWRGVGVKKSANDLWLYQELVSRTQPDLIIETGTYEGGSALFFGDLLDLNGHGHVLTIDLAGDYQRREHPRVTYLAGSSVEPSVVEQARAEAEDATVVLVVLDSDHSEEHVAAELQCYAGFVTPGSYLVVEDTNINGHPVEPDFGPGPLEAVRDFLDTDSRFELDAACEKFLMSFNAGGWLRRTS